MLLMDISIALELLFAMRCGRRRDPPVPPTNGRDEVKRLPRSILTRADLGTRSGSHW